MLTDVFLLSHSIGLSRLGSLRSVRLSVDRLWCENSYFWASSARKRGTRDSELHLGICMITSCLSLIGGMLTIVLLQMLTPGALPAENKQAQPTL
jgi:hypothetical protein